MLTAVMARPPVPGGKVVSVDDSKAKAIPGVRQVVQIPSGVAVLADGYWAAKQGRDALEIKWDDGANAALSSARRIARCWPKARPRAARSAATRAMPGAAGARRSSKPCTKRRISRTPAWNR